MLLQGYIALFFAGIAISLAAYLPLALILRKKGIGLIRQLSGLLLYFSIYFIVFATFIIFYFPYSFNPGKRFLNLQPFLWFWEGNIAQRFAAEIRPNIMIFIPLGFIIPVVFRRIRRLYLTASTVFAVTLSIEFCQYFVGRKSDIDDLIANLLGGIIGYGIFKITNRLFISGTRWRKFIGAARRAD